MELRMAELKGARAGVGGQRRGPESGWIGVGGQGKNFGLAYKWGGKPGLRNGVMTLNSEFGHCRKLRANRHYFSLHR